MRAAEQEQEQAQRACAAQRERLRFRPFEPRAGSRSRLKSKVVKEKINVRWRQQAADLSNGSSCERRGLELAAQ